MDALSNVLIYNKIYKIIASTLTTEKVYIILKAEIKWLYNNNKTNNDEIDSEHNLLFL